MADLATIPAIERTIELEADPARVWRAVTDPAEVGTWFAEECELDLRPGGEGWLGWRAHGRFHVRVEAVEEPRRFAWRWARDPGARVDDGPSTLVEYEIELRPGGGTVLRVRESGFEAPEDRAGNVHGWIGCFTRLLGHVADEPWQAGIARTDTFRASPDEVWRAFAEPARFAAWFGGQEPVEPREGAEGWFVWPSEGRFAMRYEIVEPPRYLAWRWATEPDVPLADAGQVLRTEWLVVPREDGGTDLVMLESGFRGPRDHELNADGWSGEVIPALRRALDDA